MGLYVVTLRPPPEPLPEPRQTDEPAAEQTRIERPDDEPTTVVDEATTVIRTQQKPSRQQG